MTAGAGEAAHVTFFVHGTPASKGSKNACVRNGRAVMYEATSKKLGPWMRAVKAKAGVSLIGMDWNLEGPMSVQLRFFLPRPKHHYGSRAGKPYLRSDAPMHVSSKPDIDKTSRAILDALAGIAFLDDAQVYSLTATKDYGNETGCTVTIEAA